jgi:hypothetical protein
MTPSIAAVSYTYAKYLPIKVGAAIERGELIRSSWSMMGLRRIQWKKCRWQVRSSDLYIAWRTCQDRT